MLAESVAVLGVIGLGCGVMLVWASRKFHVEVDPRMEAIIELLPGANCGACGCAGCVMAAERITNNDCAPDVCTSVNFTTIKSIAEIMGVEVEEKERQLPVVQCNGGVHCQSNFHYDGLEDCRAAMLIAEGEKACSFGCIGHGSCVKACPWGALRINEERLPEVDDYECRGCGLCVKACPKGVLALGRFDGVFVYCLSEDKGKYVKQICEYGCMGCGICAKVCPAKAITISNNLALINQELCDGCGICIQKCPRKSIQGRGKYVVIASPPAVEAGAQVPATNAPKPTVNVQDSQ